MRGDNSATDTRHIPLLESSSGLKISQVAACTGLSTHTLRYYEAAGLLGVITREANGRRVYFERDVEHAILLTKLRISGMSVAEVRRLVDLSQHDNDSRARDELLRQHRDRVNVEIANLRNGLETINAQLDSAEGTAPSKTAQGVDA